MSSAPFESFLLAELTSWLDGRIAAGQRYQYKSADSANTREIINHISTQSTESIAYREIRLPLLATGSAKLVCIAHQQNGGDHYGYNEHFISGLRDAIADNSGELAGCALLIIHNSLLDTLINSARDLSEFGAAWSLDHIRDRIAKHIESNCSAKNLAHCLLASQAAIIEEDGGGIFGFKPLYQALGAQAIDLTAFDLLPDQSITQLNDRKQIEKRLIENKEIYDRIDYVLHHFPEEIEDRLTKDRITQFGDKFIQEHIRVDSDDWKCTDFNDYHSDRMQQWDKSLEFASVQCEGGALIGPRNKSESASGRRTKHLILCLDEPRQLKLNISFTGNPLSDNEVRIKDLSSPDLTLQCKVRNNPINKTITLNGSIPAGTQYFTVTIERSISSECYRFHCVVLERGAPYLSSIENIFLINARTKSITLQTDEHSLCINETINTTCTIDSDDQHINCFDTGAIDFEELYQNSESVCFNLVHGNDLITFVIEGMISQDSLSLPLLIDKDRHRNLFNDDYCANYNTRNGKVVIDHNESQVVAMRKVRLDLEHQLVSEGLIALNNQAATSMEVLREIDESLYMSYRDFVAYLSNNGTLPSLASWGPEMQERVRALAASYKAYLLGVPRGGPLDKQHKTVMQLGLVTHDGKSYLSPLHPLILSYYLKLAEEMCLEAKGDDPCYSFARLPSVTRKRLSPKGLIPYLSNNGSTFNYAQAVDDNPMWVELVAQEDTSYSYVSKLVVTKINEICQTFAKLFDNTNGAPLIINSVNSGTNTEMFRGIVDHIRANNGKSHHIHVNLYDDQLCETEFDLFAEAGSYDEIKERHALDKGKAKLNADAIIDTLRSHLSFSKFTHADASAHGQTWSHLTFFKNNQEIQIVDHNVSEHRSGIACDGLLCGEASITESECHRTAFGLAGCDTSDYEHLEIARLFNTLWKPAHLQNQLYHDSSAIGLAVSNTFRELLRRSYDSSIWTVIIDPKVTLDFFGSEERDLVLIHYSDQYTSSAGYDAITVTKQIDLYRNALGHHEEHYLSEFNAFNGEWLLGMVTANDNIRRERNSTIAAWKLGHALLANKDVIWIPISVAELIRVSGNVGLRMADSDFARILHEDEEFKGAMSDDILFVGLNSSGHMHLLPVEVKVGAPNLDKARRQARNLLSYLRDGLLGPRTLESRIYRGIFMRQILLQIEKYQLYQVFPEDYFAEVITTQHIWLNGDYVITPTPDYYDSLVIAFMNDSLCFQSKRSIHDDLLQLELPESYIPDLLGNSAIQVAQNVQANSNPYGLSKDCFLGERPHQRGEVSEVSGQIALKVEDKQQGESVARVSHDPTQLTGPTAANPTPVAPRIHHQHSNGIRIRIGDEIKSGKAVIFEPNNTDKVMNPNTAIIGTMGTGKTQFTKSLVTQLVREQSANVGAQPLGILIFDYKADYVDEKFVAATGAKVYEPCNLPFNPFALFGSKLRLPIHTASQFRSSLATSFGLGPKQENRIKNVVLEAYQRAGISRADASTWSLTPPTLADVWDTFNDQERVEEDSLYAALDELNDFQIFEPDPLKTTSLYDALDGVVVIKLSGIDQKIQNLIVSILLDIFYAQMHQHGHSVIQGNMRQLTKFILVDEADNFMKQDFDSLRKIMKEGREFGVGTILSTQEMSHFKTNDNDYSHYILTWIVHKVASIKAQDVRTIFNTNSKQEEDALMSQIRELEKHTSLYVGGDKSIRMINDLPFWQL